MKLVVLAPVALLAIVAAARGAAAQGVADAPLSHGTLAFDAKATLGAFTGTTSTLTGGLTGSTSLAGVRGWVEAPANSLTTRNGHRDRDMAGSLEPGKYPTVRFDLETLSVGAASADSTAVTLHGNLTIHGQTREVGIPGWVWIRPGSARFRGELPVNVKDYGVGGLSKMLGMLKMNAAILVRMDVTFSK